jgi:hypothetical protein
MTGQSVDVGAAERVAPLVEDSARRPLVALSTFAFIAVCTGTFMYCYPNTMEGLQTAMVVTHDVSGDLTLAATAWYLAIHLKRVWRMWRRVLQRWSGYFAVAVFAGSGVTGIYGQLYPMPAESVMGIVHIVSSIAAVVIGCFHGGYGLRRKLR